MCNPIRLPSIDDRYPSSSAKERVQLPSLEEIIPDFNPHYRPSFIQGLHHDRPLPSDQQLNGRTRATSYDHNYQHSKHHSHNFNNSNAPVYLDRPVHAFPQNYTSSQYCSSAYPSTSASHPSSASSSSSISSVSQSSVFNANRTRSSIGALPSSSSSISSISSYNPQHKLPSSASLGDPNSSYSAQTSPSHFGYLGGYSTRAPSGSGAAGAIINGPSAGFGPVNLSTSPDIGSGTYGSGAAVGGASLIDLHGHNKKKEIKRRTRTGCLTCQKRRIKCDERKPFCLNCEKSKKECMGYEKKYVVNDKKPGDKLLLSSHNQHQHQHPSQHQHPYHAQQHILHMHKFQLVMNN